MDTGISLDDRALNPGLTKAIRIAGSEAALAKAIGRSQASVWEWSKVTGRVSAEDAVAIERATGVPAETISPAIHQYVKIRRLRARSAA